MLVDRGFLSYPRFSISFRSVDTKDESHVTYKFAGPPARAMSVGFVVVGDGSRQDSDRDLRNSDYSNVVVNVVLTRGGTTIVTLESVLKDWELARSSQRLMFWHQKLRDIGFLDRGAYEMRIHLSHTNLNKGSLVLTPVLEGGGNETP